MRWMQLRVRLVLLIGIHILSLRANSQVNEGKLGAWYMYFWSAQIKDTQYGFQGDAQYRSWNLIDDVHQTVVRGGPTWTPKNTKTLFTLGAAWFLNGPYGPGSTLRSDYMVYQEALLPHQIGRVTLAPRFRFEQRWVHDQDFRTRYRFHVTVLVPFNDSLIRKGVVYLHVFDEIFINGQRNVGGGKTVELFDRNWTYGAIGYQVGVHTKLQLGYMYQITDIWSKGQLQVSVHQKF